MMMFFSSSCSLLALTICISGAALVATSTTQDVVFSVDSAYDRTNLLHSSREKSKGATSESFIALSHRKLTGIACTYPNGTTGVKCDGMNACESGWDAPVVGCGSCNGDFACAYFDGGFIGENSCNGESACFAAYGEIGVMSCNGNSACKSTGANIGNCLCNGLGACEWLTCSANLFDVDNCLIQTHESELKDQCEMCHPTASKVKIQSTTRNTIQLNEVEVLSGGTNVVYGKTATQGSTFRNEMRFSALKAIDRDMTTFSHAAHNGCGWLEIDLGGPHDIESVTLYNRACDGNDYTGCLCRLSHATISLLTDDGSWVDGTRLGDTCGKLEVTHNFKSDYCSGQNPEP